MDEKIENKSQQVKISRDNCYSEKETYPNVTLNGQTDTQTGIVKYLGMHFDRRVNWRYYIFMKKFGLKLSNF